jgi:hypothetical protein
MRVKLADRFCAFTSEGELINVSRLILPVSKTPFSAALPHRYLSAKRERQVLEE